MTEEKFVTKKLPIEYVIPKELITRYSNNVIVQHTDNEFIISFFEVAPPIVIGTSEEKAAQVEKIDKVEANCVARIVVSADMIEKIIGVMQENFDRYKSELDESMEDANG